MIRISFLDSHHQFYFWPISLNVALSRLLHVDFHYNEYLLFSSFVSIFKITLIVRLLIIFFIVQFVFNRNQTLFYTENFFCDYFIRFKFMISPIHTFPFDMVDHKLIYSNQICRVQHIASLLVSSSKRTFAKSSFLKTRLHSQKKIPRPLLLDWFPFKLNVAQYYLLTTFKQTHKEWFVWTLTKNQQQTNKQNTYKDKYKLWSAQIALLSHTNSIYCVLS